ncbi:MAG: hypothetical protein LUD47_01610 [Clostridia bacterium]|nr:hypothetical protein [Clostridia bacterium]
MNKKIRLLLEYGSFPVWICDADGLCLDTDLPDEVKQNEELRQMFDDIQNRYDSQFINTSHEFAYIGFKSKEERFDFVKDCRVAIQKLKDGLNDEYEITDDISQDLTNLEQ